MKRLFLIFLFLLISCPAWGATITACASGCDHTTIQAALNAVTGDDTIQLSAETYTELLTFGATQSGKNITIQGVTGTIITNASTASTQQIIKIDTPYTSGTLTINNLSIQGVARLIRYYGLGNITFNNCTVGGSNYYIFYSVATGGTITFNNSALSHSSLNNAVTLSTNQNLYINGCTITNTGGNFFVTNTDIGTISIKSSTIDISGVTSTYQLYYSATGTNVTSLIMDNNVVTAGSTRAMMFDGSATSVIFTNNTLTGTTGTANILIGVGVDGATTARHITSVKINNNKATFTNGHSHGILIGKGVLGGSVYNNTVTGADNSIVIKSDNVLVHNNTAIGTSGDLSGIYIRGGRNNRIYNNTVYQPNGHGVQIDTQAGGTTPSGNIVENNIFYILNANAYAIQDFTGTADGNADNNIFDYNIYYMAGGGAIASLNYGGTPPTVLTTLANLQAGWETYSTAYPTNDAHSLSSDPLFISNGVNFHLQSGSPAKGAGLNVGLSNTNPPDIGAEPYQQYVPWR